jgi:hypothetical protein
MTAPRPGDAFHLELDGTVIAGRYIEVDPRTALRIPSIGPQKEGFCPTRDMRAWAVARASGWPCAGRCQHRKRPAMAQRDAPGPVISELK